VMVLFVEIEVFRVKVAPEDETKVTGSVGGREGGGGRGT